MTLATSKVGLLNGISGKTKKQKKPTCQCKRHETVSITGSGRSPAGGHATHSSILCLGNPMDRGAWQATVYGVTQSHDECNLVQHSTMWLIKWAALLDGSLVPSVGSKHY